VFENRLLRTIFGHNEELHNLYATPNIVRMIKSRKMRCAGRVARMGEMKSAYKVAVGKPEGNRILGSPGHKWEDNTEMYFEETE
jgi:hypothetical protein